MARTFSDGFTTAIVLSAALSLAGALAGLALPRRRRANKAGVSASSAAEPANAIGAHKDHPNHTVRACLWIRAAAEWCLDSPSPSPTIAWRVFLEGF